MITKLCKKEAEDTRNLKRELSIAKADNKTLQRRGAELDTQVRRNAKACTIIPIPTLLRVGLWLLLIRYLLTIPNTPNTTT
jgi:hypothetical protein